MGKKKKTYLVAQQTIKCQCMDQKLEHQSNQWNGANHTQVPIKSNTTKKKTPPDQAPIKPNKGSALPSKGKQEKDQAPNQIKALIESRRQKDKNLILKKEDQ